MGYDDVRARLDEGIGADTDAVRLAGDCLAELYLKNGLHANTDYIFRLSVASSQDIAQLNDRFNQELQQQIDGTLPSGHIYQLGLPDKILRSTGIPNLPIQMSATRLNEKATLFGHDYELSEVRDLVKALQKPLAIFAYGDKKKAQNIIVSL